MGHTARVGHLTLSVAARRGKRVVGEVPKLRENSATRLVLGLRGLQRGGEDVAPADETCEDDENADDGTDDDQLLAESIVAHDSSDSPAGGLRVFCRPPAGVRLPIRPVLFGTLCRGLTRHHEIFPATAWLSDVAGDTSTADGTTDPAEAGRDDAGGSTTDPVEARLADALERVAHGAVVSVPSVLLEQGLALAFTATLTNGFSAAAYGVFVVARRFQAVLIGLSMGVRGGVSRFLPNAETATERDLIATFGTALQVGVAALFGLALYVAAPAVADLTPGVTGGGTDTATFVRYLRIFAVGLPAVVWLFAVVTVMRGLEEVGALNLLQRVAFPLAAFPFSVGLIGWSGVLMSGEAIEGFSRELGISENWTAESVLCLRCSAPAERP